MTALEWKGARIPVYRKWVLAGEDRQRRRIFLVGDAAAQVKFDVVAS